ncbi:hypothetical protein [Mycobacterium noviomagense]|uniref:Secreted protein n=1 Tax=Mycobacterium noviomagense TaxID=459858 RepID=A0A7I7PBG0_9MYCO|nr:hypothetical protein [Mycobacterium noviomagense]ORB17822.1 hypothetical protein BST37_03590 [Mycobacterium noviomagense]BBY05937.1 hypothetical protein MNVI_12550 [Mycobacterium noviomagense]
MKRLVAALAGAGLLLAVAPPAGCPAASNTATTLFPLDDGTQLQTFARLDCDRRTADGVTGFPSDLWSRQSTEVRPTDRLAYLDVHASAQFDRVHKEGGRDEVTTIYLGEGPPEKYQTTGRIDSTDWRTGQPRTDEKVIMCTHIQVVYSGVNITSPSTCAQARFS